VATSPFLQSKAPAGEPGVPPWRVLLVDDEPMVHTVTRLALRDMQFAGRGVEFHSATSAAEARQVLAKLPDLAVAWIDVVMEHDQAGLELVNYIRNVEHNTAIRLVLQTGQPGLAPEREALSKYDINAYIDKANTDANRLYATLLTALRSYNEVLQLQNAMRYLEQLAITDQRTGLQNSKSLPVASARALRAAQRRHEPVTVVFMDVDDFKRVNDERGHLASDEVLRAVGAAILANSRAEDSCFRYGGDEFVTILPNCTEEQALNHYCRRLSDSFALAGVSVSMGAAHTGPDRYESIETLIHRADVRMYTAKRHRRLERVHLQSLAHASEPPACTDRADAPKPCEVQWQTGV